MDSNNSFNDQKLEQANPDSETSEDVISTDIFSNEEENAASEINEPGFCLKETIQGMYDYCAVPFYMLEILVANVILFMIFIAAANDNSSLFYFLNGTLGLIDVVLIVRLFIPPIKKLNKTPPQIYPDVSKTIKYSWGLWISGVIIAVSFAFCSFSFKGFLINLGIVTATAGTWIWYSFFMRMEEVIISPELRKDQKVSSFAFIFILFCIRNFLLMVLCWVNPGSSFFLKLLTAFGCYQIMAWLFIGGSLFSFHRILGYLIGSKTIDQKFYSDDLPAIKEKLYTPLILMNIQAELDSYKSKKENY